MKKGGTMPNRALIASFAFGLLVLLAPHGAIAAPVISVGSFPVSPVPSYIPQPLPDASFLVPVEISGAVNLQNWGFDLLFDDSVVTQVQPDPFGGDVGVYGAEFVPGDSNSLSFLLSGGFLLPGDLSGVAGS